MSVTTFVSEVIDVEVGNGYDTVTLTITEFATGAGANTKKNAPGVISLYIATPSGATVGETVTWTSSG
jgi:hypothetical protein